MGDHAFDVDADCFPNVGNRLVERVAFGVTSRQRWAHRMIPAVGLRLEDRGKLHDGMTVDRERLGNGRQSDTGTK